MGRSQVPQTIGLYDPQHEHDSCGVGFIVRLDGEKSHKIVQDGIVALENLKHRGACGCEVNTGDGAGRADPGAATSSCATSARSSTSSCRRRDTTATGLFFAAHDKTARDYVMQMFAAIVWDEGCHVLGWRDVPTDNSRPRRERAGGRAAGVPGVHRRRHDRGPGRLRAQAVRHPQAASRTGWSARGWTRRGSFYFPSLSSRTLVYKGMLMPVQVRDYFPDLQDPRMKSALCMFHSRFSTNTFPSWRLAHPYRMISHNGEINTLRGNINWMRAREALFESPLFGKDLEKIMPIIDERGSDTACFDNALELLVHDGPADRAGRDDDDPGAVGRPRERCRRRRRTSTTTTARLMEPWDGPASIAFTDGRTIGAVLDRNGLRPSRYYVTKDDYVIMASEVGVLPIPPENILHKGRLQPGRMFLVSLDEGRIIDDAELKHKYRERAARTASG